ncbi:hypothetical protein AGMMS50262_22840 [Bacteroidia bacterium]|nr:hypothetical protein AGMMS50262_22840 [Bacteroidia bacterium]
MKGYWKKTKNDSIRPKYDYLFIPEILLKKSKKLYQNIDSTNLVQYFNPKSMYYHQTLVSVDSAYVGDIRAWGSKVGVNDYDPKPKVDDFVYEILYKNLLEIKPDVVFQVRNGGYFFIRQNKLFALFPLYEPVVYPIDEYTEKFKDDIFFLFGYEPREEPIIAY